MNGRKFNWENLYGEFGEGEYNFILSDNDSLTILISFKIDEEGKITYNKAEY